MILHKVCLLALLVVSVVTETTTTRIDCSAKDSCFGEPLNCDPDTGCSSLLHFDTTNGHMNLFLRNFSDPFGYAAFAMDHHPEERIEYFICLPQQGQRLRAVAKFGGTVMVTKQDMTGVVQKISPEYFRCLFDDIPEMHSKLKKGEIRLSKGIFDKNLSIPDGMKLYNLESHVADSNESEGLLEDEVIPIVHPIRGEVQKMEDVYTSEDEESVSDAFDKLPKGSRSREDEEMEKLARKKKTTESVDEEKKPRRHNKARRTSAEEEDMEEDEEEEIEEPRRRQHTPRSRSRPGRYQEEEEEEEEERRPRGRISKRPSRYEEEEPEDSDEDQEKVPKRKSRKRVEDVDEEEMEEDEETEEKKPRRRSSKKEKKREDIEEDDEEESEDNDDYEDEDNSGASMTAIKMSLFIAIVMLFF